MLFMSVFGKNKQEDLPKTEQSSAAASNGITEDHDLLEATQANLNEKQANEDDILLAGGEIETKMSITNGSVGAIKTAYEIKKQNSALPNFSNKPVAAQQSASDEEKKYNFKTKNQQKSNNLLETLIANGVLTHDQVRVAETQAKKTGDSIVDTLIHLNFVTESVIHGLFENRSNDNNDKVHLIDMIPDMELLKNIPISFAMEHKVIPISKKQNKIIVASSSPYDIVLSDQLSSLFHGAEIEMIPYQETELISAIDKFYNGNVIADLSNILSEMELNVDNAKAADTDKENKPVVKFVNALIYEAIHCGASDIHIEPDEMFVRIRMRIDGVLMNKTIVHKNYWSGICIRVKVLSGMNIAESRKPQDGGMKMTIQGREIDFRVSAIPTIYGENIVIRVLDKTHNLSSLKDLGFNKQNLKLIDLALQKPEGIIISTGPTGSGKTTTLYSILSMINDMADNIMTLEEPVEYRLPMIRQSEINNRAGFDFASGLRSLLRQDPDVIFLGEIRDKETAEIAVRASMTGHQVFSTLHTNNALSAVTRLIDIGIQPYMLSDSLTAVLAQRLVRKLCPDCKKTEAMSDEIKQAFGLPNDKTCNFCSPVGCEKCNQTGYRGRIIVSEVLFVDAEIKNAIATNINIKELTDLANKKGFVSMQKDAIIKVAKGITSLEEVKRVVDMTEYTRHFESQTIQ